MTIDVLIVDAEGDAVAVPYLRALIEGDACECVLGTKEAFGGLSCILRAVVNLVLTEISEDAECSGGAMEVVLEGSGDDSSRDPLLCSIYRFDGCLDIQSRSG